MNQQIGAAIFGLVATRMALLSGGGVSEE